MRWFIRVIRKKRYEDRDMEIDIESLRGGILLHHHHTIPWELETTELTYFMMIVFNVYFFNETLLFIGGRMGMVSQELEKGNPTTTNPTRLNFLQISAKFVQYFF